MWKILLVDDEKLEREGIAGLIDWPAQSMELIGAAKNGVEALDIIRREHPNIVITDIKMPVVSGLDLIEKTGAEFPDIFFIVLSGYGDYDLTSKAMLYGVRHYLLKPVTRDKIMEVLNDAERILQRRESEQAMVRNLEGNFERVLPHVKQQFLRDAALTQLYDHTSCAYYQRLFHIPDGRFRLVLLLIDRNCDFVDRFALKNIAEEIIGDAVLTSIIERYVALLVPDSGTKGLTSRLEEILKKYKDYFSADLIASVSDPGAFDSVHELYKQSRNLLGVYFERTDTRIIFSHMAVGAPEQESQGFAFATESIYQMVNSGKIAELNCSLDIVFSRMQKNGIGMSVIRSYCKKLIHVLLDPNFSEDGRLYTNLAPKIDTAEDAEQLCILMKSMTTRLASEHLDSRIQCHSPTVEDTVRCIYENIDNSQLSLAWIAHDVLFMNGEYLGRLFQREMHEKFSAFVLRVRLNMAKKLIENTHDLKIYEISRMTGFADDAQYFSRMFKNYAQYTPTEYKRLMEKRRSEEGKEYL